MKEIFEKLWRLAKPYLDTRGNELHTSVVIEFAYRLLKTEKGDEDIVIPAAILHDVGWKAVPEELQHTAYGPKMSNPELKRLHETEGVKIARKILEEAGYDAQKTTAILQIIDGHDTRKQALFPEDAIVKDADKLWRYSKQGFYNNIKKFGETHEQGVERLASNMESWFFTGSAKSIAKEELRSRVEEGKTAGEQE